MDAVYMVAGIGRGRAFDAVGAEFMDGGTLRMQARRASA